MGETCFSLCWDRTGSEGGFYRLGIITQIGRDSLNASLAGEWRWDSGIGSSTITICRSRMALKLVGSAQRVKIGLIAVIKAFAMGSFARETHPQI